MKTFMPALGASAVSALIVAGAFYAAVRGSPAEAGPVLDRPLPALHEARAMTISTAPEAAPWRAHAIPDSRRDVRMVGPRFFPDPDKSLHLAGAGS